jgi:hypothetical protein
MIEPETTSADDRDRLTRRGFLGVGGGAAAALALAACGGGSSRSTSTVTAESGREAASASPPPPYRSRPDLRPPRVLVDRRPAVPGDELYVLTECHGGSGQQGPMIIDRAGRLKWFMPVSDNGTVKRRTTNLRVQTLHGEPVLTFWVGGLVASHGAGHYEIYDQHYRQVARVQAANGLRGDLHEFLITPQNTALITAYAQGQGTIPNPDGQGTRPGAYWYCCAQEIDIASGKLLLEWRSDHEVPFSASRKLPTPESPTDPWDYFHMNSIAVDPTDDNLVISSRNLWQVYKVDRHTGKTLWRLGGTGSDFDVPADAQFAFQHHVVPHGGGIYTIFDNESGPPDIATQSRGLVLEVDEAHRQVRLVREYHHRPPVLSDALGSVQPLDAGDTTAEGPMFMGWGESSYFTEWDAHGRVVLDAKLSGGVISYRAFQQAWTGIPRVPPRVAVDRQGGGLRIYVSWNGATVHRQWRVLGGSKANALTQLTTAPVTGFESQIPLGHVPRWLMLEALDVNGEVAGKSDVIRVAA